MFGVGVVSVVALEAEPAPAADSSTGTRSPTVTSAAATLPTLSLGPVAET